MKQLVAEPLAECVQAVPPCCDDATEPMSALAWRHSPRGGSRELSVWVELVAGQGGPSASASSPDIITMCLLILDPQARKLP